MKITLDPKMGFVTNGQFNQREALKDAGVKAAVCFREGEITPSLIRETETDERLIARGIETIYQDHTTPTEHQCVGLEITGIPKILCMILNNQHQYTACERSLRYTELKQDEGISAVEVRLYHKWVAILEKIIKKELWNFYLYHSNSEKEALRIIHKVACENARYLVGSFMETTITYTVPWIQINKILVYMEQVISNPLNELEQVLVPYMEDFIRELKALKVALTKQDIYNLTWGEDASLVILREHHREITSYAGDESLFYQNNKYLELSLLSWRNKFTAINRPNRISEVISYSNLESIACLAQEQRHRTIALEMQIPQEFRIYIPKILEDDFCLREEWLHDASLVQDLYPQGQLVRVNRQASIHNLINYVTKERCCDRAQLEIEDFYVNVLMPDIYDELMKTGQIELASLVAPYLDRTRCQFSDYHCPNNCHHPRRVRKV